MDISKKMCIGAICPRLKADNSNPKSTNKMNNSIRYFLIDRELREIKIYFTIIFMTIIVSTFHNDALAANRIFLLDTSQSIKKDGLFDKIKENLKQNYVSAMKQGEHMILLTFNEKIVVVVDQKIVGEDDINRVNNQIDTLNATGLWTWMTKALQITLEQGKRLKAQYPNEELKIYFLTDGIDDPPPAANESPLKFIELLEKYFKNSVVDDAYIYVLVYKENGKPLPLTEKQQKKIEKDSKGRIKIDTRSRSSDPIPPEISIGYSGSDFGIINFEKGDVARTFSIGVKELRGNIIGKVVDILYETDPLTQFMSLKIVPDNFEIREEGQIEKITIHIPQGISHGEYAPVLKLSSDDDVLISPGIIPIKFKTVKVGDEGGKGDKNNTDSQSFDWDLIQKFLIIALLLAFLYFLLLILRRRSLWVRKNGQDEKSLTVKNMKKESLSNKVGLPSYQVGFAGILPQNIFSVCLFKNNKKIKKITMNDPVKCQDQQGQDIIITFSNKPSTVPPEKAKPDLEVKKLKPDIFEDDKKNTDFL